MYKDIAILIYTEQTENENGFPVETQNKIEVFVNKKSVTRTEFYAASQAGYKPSIAFELRTEDFELTKHTIDNKAVYADKIDYEGSVYDIIRTYSKNESMIELVCG